MKKITGGFLLLLLASFVSIFCLSGCDEGAGTVALYVTPSTAHIGGETNSVDAYSVTFTVGGTTNVQSGLRPLSLPLKWSVTNPGLGSIGAAGGYSAVYVRDSGSGMNTVIVRDQYGAEGVATVWQE